MLRLVRRALKRVTAHSNWLLWIDLTTLIPPWHVPQAFANLYSDPPDDAPDADAAEGTEEREELTPIPAEGAAIERLQRSYAAAVSYVDSIVGTIVEEIADHGSSQETLVLLTSDRGLPLGDHPFLTEPSPWLYEEKVHLPLIIRLPGNVEGGRRVNAFTQTADIPATLADAFGLGDVLGHGHSLLSLCHGDTAWWRPFAVAGVSAGADEGWVLRTHRWSLLLATQSPAVQPRLFVKPDDRWEVNDVQQHHPQLTQSLEQTLKAFIEGARAPGPLTYPPLPAIEAATEPRWPQAEPRTKREGADNADRKTCG
jgi:arylsulfatase A-like enzyme